MSVNIYETVDNGRLKFNPAITQFLTAQPYYKYQVTLSK